MTKILNTIINSWDHTAEIELSSSVVSGLTMKSKKNPDLPFIAIPCDFSSFKNSQMFIKIITGMSVKGCNILLLDNKQSFEKQKNLLEKYKVSGIILPGGADIPSSYYNNGPQNHPRTNLGLNLLRYAENNNIPTMGICRGLQLIGVYLGAKLTNIDEFIESHNRKPMTVTKGSFLFDELLRKYNKHIKNKTDKTNIYKNLLVPTVDENSNVTAFTLQKACNHHQCIDNNTIENTNIKVLAKSSDGVIEAAEYNNPNNPKAIIYGYQSHPEKVYYEDKVAKTLVKKFVKQVKLNSTY